MLYEMIGIVRQGNVAEVKEIALAAGRMVLASGGVVRSISNWGTFALPNPVTRHQRRHVGGHYFVMRFDASGTTQVDLRKTLGPDPRVVRLTCVKLGSNKTVDSMAKYGKVSWNGEGLD